MNSKVIENLDLDSLSPTEARIFDEVAADTREPFNEFIGTLYRGKEHCIDWLVSALASRDINRSSLYRWCCQLRFVDALLHDGWTIGKIRTNSPAMQKVLKEHLSKQPITVELSTRLSQRIKKWFIGPASHLWTAWNFFRQYIGYLVFPTGHYSGKTPLTLLDTFVLRSSFSNNDYQDRYYGELLSLLTEEEKADIYYLPTFYQINNYSGIYREIKYSKQQFLLKESYLKPIDYLTALGHPLRLSRMIFHNTTFLGIDIQPLLKEELKDSRSNRSSMIGLLNYNFVQRLKHHQVDIRLVINWFENQGIDRGLVAGFRSFYPETPITGYEGFTIPDSFIHLRPTRYEVDHQVVPQQIAVIGRGLLDIVKEFCPELKVGVAPAFRFTSIWHDREVWADPSRISIMVALPLAVEECAEILRLLLQIVNIFNERYRFLIKPHPAMPVKVLKNSLNSWPQVFEIINGDFIEVLEICNMLVGYSSTTCMEALARGIPVIIIGSKSGLTENPIPTTITQDIWRMCYTAEEVQEAISFYGAIDEEIIKSYAETGKSIRSEYFEPVTPQGVREFLKINDVRDHTEVR